MEDFKWSGCPKEATTDENVELVHSLCSIARQKSISFGSVQSIMTDILGCPRSQLDGSPEC